jgi:hypothetical protein
MAGGKGARFRTDGQVYQDLLDGVLAHAPAPDATARVRNFKLAALEVAVLQYPDALDVACGRISKRMRALKVGGIRTEDLEKDAPEEPVELTTVRAALPNAPVETNIRVPFGYELSTHGVRKLGDEPVQVLSCPVIVAGRARDENRREELIELGWLRNGYWQQRVVERVEVADARRVVGLAAYGVPVTSNNARSVIQYISEFEAENLSLLPSTCVSRQLGWQETEVRDVFLLGSRHLVTETGLVEVDESHGSIQFRGADEGDDQLALGLTRGGSLEGWLEAVRPVEAFPRVRLALYTSFVPVVLPIVNAANFVLSFAGETSLGKTITLRVAGSVWGSPDESRPLTIVFTWDGTAVWRERAPATLNNLPLILDDTKRARKPQDVEQTIYDVSQGRGRGRGSPKGLARQQSWQTVLLTSGEQPIASFTQAGGTRARVLETWGSPFGQKCQQTGALVRQLNHEVKQNYGHAGPRFAQFLIQNRDKWEEWSEEYRRLVQEYENRAGDNSVAGRLADHFAVIRLTARLVHEAIEMPWPYCDPVEPLWADFVQEVTEADRPAAALRHVLTWAVSHQADFYVPSPLGDNRRQPPGDNRRQPPGGWAGVWPSDSPVDPRPKRKKKPLFYVGFFPHKLDAILIEGGFATEAIVRSWKDRGWLKVSAESGAERTRLRLRVASHPSYVIAIKQEAVVAAGAG